MEKIATIKILDEINIAVIGLNIGEYKYFYNKFGYYDNGYAFKPQYKLGRWDGKVRLFSEAGKTSIHFLNDIIPEIKSFGYKIKIVDNRNPVTFELPLIDTDYFKEQFNIVLGVHQVDCINALIENRGGISIAATGAGKSYIIGALCNLLHTFMGLKVLTIVPTTDLVTQTANEIKLFGNDVGMYYANKKELNKTHLVSTWQSLQNNPAIMGAYHAIIVDEAHGAKSNVLKRMLMEHGKNAIFIAGVTGTMPKHEADKRQVNYVLGEPVANVSASHLIDLGWLAKLKLHCITLKEDFTNIWEKYKETNPEEAAKYSYKTFKSSYFPDFASERAWMKVHKKRNIFLTHFIEQTTNASGNSFVLVNGVDYGKRLSKLIPNSIFVFGKDDNEVRKQIYDSFDANDNVVVIATFQLASTGLNIKRIFNLFMIDPGNSFIRIIQSIGRGLRKAPDKESVSVWDIHSDTKYSRRHSGDRKKYYNEQKYSFKEEIIEYEDYVDDLFSGDKILDKQAELVVY
jgi:superfamily II DNA or RNA helicase